ncbi:MAG: hypothetical protein HZA91_10300 [Verrucomicrobia bacterium]|nr:hypothetical protein [Verrucomicrobiota bacterium]
MLFIAAAVVAAASASAQIELTSRVTRVTVFASGGAWVEMEGAMPTATGPVCWLDLPFDALRRSGREVQVELSPASLFDGPGRLGTVAQQRRVTARDIAGLLAANAGTTVEIGAGTNGLFRGRLRLAGELALIEEATNRTVAVSVASVSVVRRLDGPLRTEHEVAETMPILLARCVNTNAPGPLRLSYSLPDLRWSPAYELATNGAATARLTLRARIEGSVPGLGQTRGRFALAPNGPGWEVAEVGQGSPVLFEEDVPCERLAQVVLLDDPKAPVMAHPALRLANRGAQPWPAGPAGRLAMPLTPAGGSALVVLEEAAPLRVDRRVKEISRRPAADGSAREEVLAVGSVTLANPSPWPVRALVLRAAPAVVEETSPRAVEERDAAGGRWLRWEMDVPAGRPVTLELRYRTVTGAQPAAGETRTPR